MSDQQAAAFFTRINNAISRYDLLCHPFYKAWAEGTLTREDLREYAAEYYHHVAAFPTYLSAFHSRLADGELRRTVLRNLADEEIEGAAHSDLWLQFAQGMGAVDSEVRDREPIAEIEELTDSMRSLARDGSKAEALAAFFAYESQVPKVAESKLTGLKSFYGADDRTCAYFKLHRTADVHHSKVWQELLTAEVAGNKDEQERAIVAAERTAEALWHALDGIERQRQLRLQ